MDEEQQDLAWDGIFVFRIGKDGARYLNFQFWRATVLAGDVTVFWGRGEVSSFFFWTRRTLP